MFNILLVIHAFLCIVLMGLVLIQQGKGADMGAAFGGNSTTLFGAAGAADFLTKLTTGIAISFMVSSIFLVRAYSQLETSPQSVANPLDGSVMGGAVPPVVEIPAEQIPADKIPAENVPPKNVDATGKVAETTESKASTDTQASQEQNSGAGEQAK